MSEELIRRLIEFLETASPHVWEVVGRQVLVVTVQSFVWFFIAIAVAVLCAVWAKKEFATHNKKYDMHDMNGQILAGLAAVATTIAAFLMSDIVGYVLNPDYRAIKILLELIK